LLVVWAGFGFAQTPTAIIKIEGYSPQEIHDMGWTSALDGFSECRLGASRLHHRS
jgi:hypothetical protein